MMHVAVVFEGDFAIAPSKIAEALRSAYFRLELRGDGNLLVHGERGEIQSSHFVRQSQQHGAGCLHLRGRSVGYVCKRLSGRCHPRRVLSAFEQVFDGVPGCERGSVREVTMGLVGVGIRTAQLVAKLYDVDGVTGLGKLKERHLRGYHERVVCEFDQGDAFQIAHGVKMHVRRPLLSV